MISALKLLRLLVARGVPPAIIAEHALTADDAGVKYTRGGTQRVPGPRTSAEE